MGAVEGPLVAASGAGVHDAAQREGHTGDAKRTLAVCEMLIDDRDDMVVKAMSWALRALAQRDPKSAERFVEKNRSRLAARAVREVGNKLRTGLKNPRAESKRVS